MSFANLFVTKFDIARMLNVTYFLELAEMRRQLLLRKKVCPVTAVSCDAPAFIGSHL